MLQDQVILEYLQYGEEHLAHNIFSSVAVIHSFATKCKNREVRRFVVGALLDAVRTGNSENEKNTTSKGHSRQPIRQNTGSLSFTR